MKKRILTGILLLIACHIHAQETLPVSGGTAQGSGGTITFTIGQTMYINSTSASGSINQGIQQSFEFVTLSNPEYKALTLKAVPFPNPTTESITLALNDTDLSGLSYVMNTPLGQFISRGRLVRSETSIAMNNLPKGVYILRVQRNNKELKTFKIIKN
jgi:hypothetical protein